MDENSTKKFEDSNAMTTVNENDFCESEFTFYEHGSCESPNNTPNNVGGVPTSWILLDNQSTIDVFSSAKLLKNIRKTNRVMYIHCTAGTTSTDMVGDLPGYGTVWYHANGIANILSLSRVREKGYVINYSSNAGNVFRVTNNTGKIHLFKPSEKGLFYLNTNENRDEGTLFITTVDNIQYKYSVRDYNQAVLARKIQKIIGRPSSKQFLEIINNNLLINCPVTCHDVLAAENIFGPDLGSLKGKTVRQTPESVMINDVKVQENILERYRHVTIAADIMYVNKIAFFVTISRNIRFVTSERLLNQKAETILKAIQQVLNIYQIKNFKVTHLLMDGQFEPLRNSISGLGATLNTVARDEHVPEIERHIRTLKERVRCVRNMLPFESIPKRLVIEMVYYATFWLNCFPSKEGISNSLSPRTIITGSKVDYLKHCKLEFGEYVQVHEQHDNTLATRTVGAIALRPNGNAQGSHMFYSLNTGKILIRNQWTCLPMPREVMLRIHELAKMDPEGTDIPGPDHPHNIVVETTGSPEVITEHEPTIRAIPTSDETHDMSEYEITVDDENNANNENNAEVTENIMEEVEEDAFKDTAQVERSEMEIENNTNLDMDSKYGVRTSEHYLRPRKPRDYSHLHNTLTHIALTQYGVKRGLKKFGESGIEAIKKEMLQLHDRNVLSPVNADELGIEGRRDALPYLMFLKQKRTGQIKGRGCADGRQQRLYQNKEDASSPTVSIESVMLSSIIDASEHRDIATVDIPGAFMQADMDELVHMKIQGKMVDILVDILPSRYEKYVVVENGTKSLYVKLNKALYGTLRAALLFWRKLTGKLQEWGFIVNPYDWCVANKDFNGSQCTIVWHVDDLKISHASSEVVTGVIGKLKSVFGVESPLTITRGKIHDYLGMKLDFSTPGKVSIEMRHYITELINESPPDMEGCANTPAASHLFTINNQNPEFLNKAMADKFHTMVAKLLFLCKRARPDIQLAVAFLCTRVKRPDTDDYKKLKRVIKYLRGTLDIVLTLESNNLHVIKWWVDASFACHNDMRSHTGGIMTMGKGAAYATSIRQKLNTKSSTEGELVAVNDVMGQILWTKKFLSCQGIEVKDNIVYQDNKSAILLEANGRGSSSKRTRHLDVRYFFIKDRIDSGDVQVIYCPTERMLADFFTKPLQGALFNRCRDAIMNLPMPAASDASTACTLQSHRSVLEEPVVSQYSTPSRMMSSRDKIGELQQAPTTYPDLSRSRLKSSLY